MFPYYDPSLLDKSRHCARERSSCGSSAVLAAGGHVQQQMYSTSRARNLDDVHGFSWKMESSCSEERQLLVDTCSEERQLLVDTMGSNIINIEDVNLVRLLFISENSHKVFSSFVWPLGPPKQWSPKILFICL